MKVFCAWPLFSPCLLAGCFCPGWPYINDQPGSQEQSPYPSPASTQNTLVGLLRDSEINLKKKTTCVKQPRFWGLWRELTLLSQIEAGNVLRGRAGKPSLQSADSKAFCLCGLGGHYHNCSTVAAAVGKQRKYVSKWVWLCFNQNCPQTGSWTT